VSFQENANPLLANGNEEARKIFQRILPARWQKMSEVMALWETFPAMTTCCHVCEIRQPP
jgi:hypothetical protein